MVFTKGKPPSNSLAGYDEDYYLWITQQAALLREGLFREVDLPNIVEELEDMGRSERRAFESSYRVLLVHLLKWQFQPERRTRSWLNTIGRERDELEELEARSPSLRQDIARVIEAAYHRARREAARETLLDIVQFPTECPFAAADIRRDGWLPGSATPSHDSLPLTEG